MIQLPLFFLLSKPWGSELEFVLKGAGSEQNLLVNSRDPLFVSGLILELYTMVCLLCEMIDRQ